MSYSRRPSIKRKLFVWICVELDCPKGWFTVPPFISCYYLGKDDVKYNIAEESCKSRSSVLAKLHTVNELKAVANWIAMERYANISAYKPLCIKRV